MSKRTHFSGQPMYGQLINLLNKQKILDFSKNIGSERYVKSFDAWQHPLFMLYAVIKRLDSLREISASMYPEAHKLAHKRRVRNTVFIGIADYIVVTFKV